jgi:RNA recognition motif-containing protein
MIPNNFRILRFSLPSNDKNRCKGIGFIDVDNKETMKDIIQYFDGMLYNNMVLHANEKFYK